MRSYPLNSTRAVARLVGLTVLADGHLSKTELDSLEKLSLSSLPGIDRALLTEVVRDLVEDLMSTSYASWSSACQVELSVLQSVAAEVNDQELQQATLMLCSVVIQADLHSAEAEENFLEALAAHWRLDVANFRADKFHS